ncbi:MAG: hypothetical protein JKX70_05165 [Phycisphaerales bacterium]|nr:hypothetical protein [Phycisphaerales bacterium]
MKNFTQKTAQSFTATALVLACSGMSMIGSTAYGSPVLVNGGFENPLVGGSVVPLHTFGTQISQFHASDVPGWSTTDSENAIEIWQDGAAGVNAFEGNQFAEINATTTGTLSTMVTPSSGSMIGFEFAHRGRSSSIIADVALVEIYDLGFDGRFGTTMTSGS